MGGIRKKKAKRGIEHHKRSLEETLEAPETYGVRVSEALCERCDILSHIVLHSQQICANRSACADEDKARKKTKSSCLSSSR